MAGTDGLLHVSEIANHRVKDVRDELKEGQQILVKVITSIQLERSGSAAKLYYRTTAQKSATPAPAAKE
jgi:polyribonucleotide nucleotidyltransferase